MVKTNMCLVKISTIFIESFGNIENVPGHSAQIDRCSQKLLKLSWLAKIDSVHNSVISVGVTVHSVNR